MRPASRPHSTTTVLLAPVFLSPVLLAPAPAAAQDQEPPAITPAEVPTPDPQSDTISFADFSEPVDIVVLLGSAALGAIGAAIRVYTRQSLIWRPTRAD